MRQPRSIYLAFTAYHVLVAIELATMNRATSVGTLIVVPNFSGSQTLAEAVRRQCPELFDDVMHADFAKPGLSIWRRHFLALYFYRKLIQRLRNQKIDGVYTAKAQSSISHRILTTAKRFHPRLTGALFEDGVSIYMDDQSSAPNASFFDTVLHGKPNPANQAAQHSLIGHVYAHYPDCIPAQKTHSRSLHRLAHQANTEKIYRSLISDLYPDIIKRYGSRRWDLLLLLPKLSEITRDPLLKASILEIGVWFKRTQISLIKKYHPKDEVKADPWNQLFPNTETMPNAFPIELLYAAMPHGFRAVLGFSSAALVTAKSMLNEPATISCSAGNRGNLGLKKLFEKVGVIQVDEVGLIQEQISKAFADYLYTPTER